MLLMMLMMLLMMIIMMSCSLQQLRFDSGAHFGYCNKLSNVILPSDNDALHSRSFPRIQPQLTYHPHSHVSQYISIYLLLPIIIIKKQKQKTIDNYALKYYSSITSIHYGAFLGSSSC